MDSPSPPTVDGTDRRLLAALRRNARAPISALARALGLSRATVRQRLARLEASGVIAGYTVRLGHEVEGALIRAYCNIEVDPKAGPAVVRALGRMEAVEAVYGVSGRIDYVARLRAPTPAALEGALDAIGTIDGVRSTDSAVILSTKLER